MDGEALNVNELQFGPLFGDASKVTPLTNAEVADILQQQKNEMQAMSKEPGEAFENALAYVERVTFGLTAETVKDLRYRIGEKEKAVGGLRRKLHPFELSALINLAPEDYEQATALIPSLLEFDTVDEKEFIEEIVNEVHDQTPVG